VLAARGAAAKTIAEETSVSEEEATAKAGEVMGAAGAADDG
jgi:hypothetical protein